MAERTITIGLSLGADICWPICYESCCERLTSSCRLGRRHGALRMRAGDDRALRPAPAGQVRRRHRPADALVSRSAASGSRRRSCSTTSTSTTIPGRSSPTRSRPPIAAMMRLGLPVPETWMIPPKAYEHAADLQPTLRAYARYFDLGEIGARVGYPVFMKPYHGGGWVGVTKIDDEQRAAARLRRTAARADEPAEGRSALRLVRALRRARAADPLRELRPVGAAARPLHASTRFPRRRGPLGARGHDADHQRLLRLGLQLLRGAAQGRRLAPDRLRQRLSRQPGHLAALPLPLADQGEPALVDLLRRHRPSRCAQNLDWEPFYAIADQDMPSARSCAAMPRSPTSASRPSSSATSAATTSAISTRSPTSSSAPRPSRDAVRQKVTALFPAHEVDAVHRALLAAASRTGGEQEGAARVTEEGVRAGTRSGSSRRSALVRWGHWGQPVLVFPTAGGDAEEIERMQVIAALAPLIEAGRIKVYSCDSLAGRAFAAAAGSVDYRCALHNRFEDCIAERGGAGDPHRLPLRRTSRSWPPAPRSAPSSRWRSPAATRGCSGPRSA